LPFDCLPPKREEEPTADFERDLDEALSTLSLPFRPELTDLGTLALGFSCEDEEELSFFEEGLRETLGFDVLSVLAGALTAFEPSSDEELLLDDDDESLF
jgi:hypothetical protein